MENCLPSEIIYALSSEHPKCLQILDYYGTKNSITNDYTSFIWKSHIASFSSSDPCDPHETSYTNQTKLNLSICKNNIRPTKGDIWIYQHDGVIGGGDY